MNFDQVIDRKNTYCTQWDYVKDRFGQSDLLPFTISDTDFAIPDNVMRVLQERLNHPVFGYTRWNNGDLQQSIQSWYQKRFDTNIPSQWIVYTPSVMYIISQLIEILTDEGDGVIIQTPAYDAFFKTIEYNKRTVVKNPLLYNDHQYSIDFEDLEQQMKEPQNKVLLLCSPHNPTGRVWTEKELKEIIDLAKKYDVFIISDEIHMDILRKKQSHRPIINYETDQVAIVTSGSKTFNFPGLIFAYGLIPNDHIRNLFLKCLKEKDGLSSASILGMHATMAAYHEEEKWVDNLNHYIDGNINYVTTALSQIVPEFAIVPSEATYLMWIDVSKHSMSIDQIQDRLINRGKLAIMDGSVYGGNGKQFLRLNVGCSRKKLEEAMRRIELSIAMK